jgi:hypothetical protein
MGCLQYGHVQAAHSTSDKLDVSDSANDPDRSAVTRLRKALAVF